MSNSKGRELQVAEAAELVNVKASTWRSYVARGIAPQPVRRIGRTPLWDEQAVLDYLAARPGPGARTDLQHTA